MRVQGVAAPGPGVAGRGAAAGGPPSCNTGGKLPGQALVDWLRVTWFAPRFDVPGFLRQFALALGASGITGHECPGLHSFAFGFRLGCLRGVRMLDVGRLSYGGEHQRGRVELELSGEACAAVPDWPRLAAFLQELCEVRITRVDVAVDLFEGEFTVDHARRWFRAGRFGFVNGRPPKSRLDGDWLDGVDGRTLYVGQARNGKLLRVYEKGKQLGDLSSPWTRFEVQFSNRDRVIPFDLLRDPRRFFAAAYPALERVAGQGGERIATVVHTLNVSVRRAVVNVRQAYGKWLGVFESAGVSPAAVVRMCRRGGAPRGLSVAAWASDVFALTVKGAFSQELCP